MGPQYRSVIFYFDEGQKLEAQSVVRDLNTKGIWSSPIVTQIEPAGEFYPAEDYHREYFRQHGRQPYCQAVVAPKVAKFRSHFAARLKR